MPNCAIITCKNRSGKVTKQNSGVTYHRFPKDAAVKNKWILATGRYNWFPQKYDTVCSAHFEMGSFMRKDKSTRLSVDTIPTLKLHPVFEETTENCEVSALPPTVEIPSIRRKIQNPDKDQPSTSKATVSNKAAEYYEDSAASLLESDDDDNAESEQEMAAEEPVGLSSGSSSKESQKGKMRLSTGSLFPETPAFSITQELVMDLHELSDKIQKFYPAALGKQFTLTFQGDDGDISEYTFTSASETRRSGERHSSLRCNGCGSGIVGFRYKCVSCADYDLCSACETLGLHADHLMMRIAKPIKLKRARTLLQQWCEAMKAAGITTAEEITRGQDDQPDPDPEPQQQALSCSRSLLLEPPPLAALSSSTGTAKRKATTKAKTKAMKKSTSEEQPKKSAAKKRKIESPDDRDDTMDTEVKKEPIEDFYNSLMETEVMVPTEEIKSEYADPLGPDKIKTEDEETHPTSSSTLLGDPGPAITTSKDPRPAATSSEDPSVSFQTYTHKPSRLLK